MRQPTLILGAISLLMTTGLAAASDHVTREQEIRDLRLGQRVLVDDGTCPAGQIKEVSGSTLTAQGVTWVRKCVQRNR